MRCPHKITTKRWNPTGKPAPDRIGHARPLAIALILVICVAGAAWLYLDARARKAAMEKADPGIQLSDQTRDALRRLRAPVEIRFYALLDEDQGSGPLGEFARRVDRLLAAYDREAGDDLQVNRFQSRSPDAMNAADADGMTAFNISRGAPCYLGLTLRQADRKEELPRLSPEWEMAVEADLTRAILRVSATRPRVETEAAAASRMTALEEVRQTIPKIDDIPLEQGRQILRDLAFNELKDVTTRMQAGVEEARKQLVEARTSGSEAELKKAMKQLRDAQALQAAQLREISARVEARIKALEELKDGDRPAP